MGNGTKDLALVFNGADIAFTVETAAHRIPRDQYDAQLKKVGGSRDLLSQALGAGGPVKANLDSLMQTISTHCGGKFDTLGRVCLMGRSAGCFLALGLAVRLNTKNVAPNFLGVSDLPMYHVGVDPPIDELGDMKILNPPKVSAGVKLAYVQSFGLNYPVLGSDVTPPNVRLKGTINADMKVQLFQTNGNHVKRTLSAGWVWWSAMDDGEVHGTIEALPSERIDVRAVTDLDRHVKLNTGKPWGDLVKKAAEKLAAF